MDNEFNGSYDKDGTFMPFSEDETDIFGSFSTPQNNGKIESSGLSDSPPKLINNEVVENFGSNEKYEYDDEDDEEDFSLDEVFHEVENPFSAPLQRHEPQENLISNPRPVKVVTKLENEKKKKTSGMFIPKKRKRKQRKKKKIKRIESHSTIKPDNTKNEHILFKKKEKNKNKPKLLDISEIPNGFGQKKGKKKGKREAFKRDNVKNEKKNNLKRKRSEETENKLQNMRENENILTSWRKKRKRFSGDSDAICVLRNVSFDDLTRLKKLIGSENVLCEKYYGAKEKSYVITKSDDGILETLSNVKTFNEKIAIYPKSSREIKRIVIFHLDTIFSKSELYKYFGEIGTFKIFKNFKKRYCRKCKEGSCVKVILEFDLLENVFKALGYNGSTIHGIPIMIKPIVFFREFKY